MQTQSTAQATTQSPLPGTEQTKLSAQEISQLENYLRQFQPSQPSQSLQERLRLAAEISPEPTLNSPASIQLEAWLKEQNPAKPSKELTQRLAQKLQSSLSSSSKPFPLWQPLAAAAAVSLLAWVGIEQLNNEPIIPDTQVSTPSSENPTAKSPEVDAPATESTQETSPQLADLPLFPQSSPSSRKPFDLSPQNNPYQNVSNSSAPAFNWPEDAYSGPKNGKQNNRWQKLEFLQPKPPAKTKPSE